MAAGQRATQSRRERTILSLIIGGAVAARAYALWISRPEFIGWFNHAYYYWVQTRGILEDGRLPFADLPLLFYLYAGSASLLQALGMEMQQAIVVSTRVIMSIVPALVAYPVYRIVRRIVGFRSLSLSHWLLVALSAFLPLTFAHMPELLQKNALGLLLLCALMAATYALLDNRSPRVLILVCLLFATISLTHLGTLLVTLLFGLALLVAVLLEGGWAKRTAQILTIVASSAAVGLTAVRSLDDEAFARLLSYARSSLPDSLIGTTISSGSAGSRLAGILGILVPLAALWLLWRSFAAHRESLQLADRVFWLSNVLFAYLLILPFFDLEVLPRFLLFLPLPALVVLGYELRYRKPARFPRLVLGLASAGVLLLVFGEAMDLARRAPNKEEIHRELMDLRSRFKLSTDDLVLTTYGVNPICNWFLGTSSGLVTAFDKGDLETYDRVYVLNPSEERPAATPDNARDGDRLTFLTPQDRALAMRQRIPLPIASKPVFASDHLELYELQTVPEIWLFDAEGKWIGYLEQGR